MSENKQKTLKIRVHYFLKLLKLTKRKYSYFLHFWLFGRDTAILSKLKILKKIRRNLEKKYIFKVNNSMLRQVFFRQSFML